MVVVYVFALKYILISFFFFNLIKINSKTQSSLNFNVFPFFLILKCLQINLLIKLAFINVFLVILLFLIHNFPNKILHFLQFLGWIIIFEMWHLSRIRITLLFFLILLLIHKLLLFYIMLVLFLYLFKVQCWNFEGSFHFFMFWLWILDFVGRATIFKD